MKDIDTKLVIWLVTVVFLAGGGWWHLEAMSSDVTKIQDTLDTQQSELTIHVAAEGHTSGETRIEKIETQQNEMSRDLKTLMTNQSAICQATGARCR
tara:strand:+ start:73 stop:363 length:291 start_codon:yes stop_codon:yes gene_type:complete